MVGSESMFHNYRYCKEIILISLLLICVGFKTIGILLLGVILFFFRNNLNLKKYEKSTIISPSSSEVMSIKKEGRYNKISTYLSPLDRHYMIAPVNCLVKRIEKKLLKGDAERITVYFKDENGREFSLSQIVKNIFEGPGILGSWGISFLYDNRIICLCEEGDVLKRGERWGLIRFGSAMEYKLPSSYKMNMEIGKKYSLGSVIGNMSKKLKEEVEKREEWGSDLFENLDLRYFAICFSCVVVIFMYGKYRCENIKDHTDMLEFSLFKNSKKYGIDGWLLSHLLFFMLLGYLYPNSMRISVIFGVLWEIFEWYVGIYKPKWLEGMGFCKSPSGAKNKGKVWWYGKWQDIISNTSGFTIGKYIKTGRIV
jgi:phosphatidylserine decarboxylase